MDSRAGVEEEAELAGRLGFASLFGFSQRFCFLCSYVLSVSSALHYCCFACAELDAPFWVVASSKAAQRSQASDVKSVIWDFMSSTTDIYFT